MTPDFQRGVEAALNVTDEDVDDACSAAEDARVRWAPAAMREALRCFADRVESRLLNAAPTPPPVAEAKVTAPYAEDAYEHTIDGLASVLGDTSETDTPVVFLELLREHARDEDGDDSGSVGMMPREARSLGRSLIDAADRADKLAGVDASRVVPDRLLPAHLVARSDERIRRVLSGEARLVEAPPPVADPGAVSEGRLPLRIIAALDGLDGALRSLVSGEHKADGLATSDIGTEGLGHLRTIREEIARLDQVRENFADLIYGRVEIRDGNAVVVDCHGKVSECFCPVPIGGAAVRAEATPPVDEAMARLLASHAVPDKPWATLSAWAQERYIADARRVLAGVVAPPVDLSALRAFAPGLRLASEYHRKQATYGGASWELHARCQTAVDVALDLLVRAEDATPAEPVAVGLVPLPGTRRGPAVSAREFFAADEHEPAEPVASAEMQRRFAEADAAYGSPDRVLAPYAEYRTARENRVRDANGCRFPSDCGAPRCGCPGMHDEPTTARAAEPREVNVAAVRAAIDAVDRKPRRMSATEQAEVIGAAAKGEGGATGEEGAEAARCNRSFRAEDGRWFECDQRKGHAGEHEQTLFGCVARAGFGDGEEGGRHG